MCQRLWSATGGVGSSQRHAGRGGLRDQTLLVVVDVAFDEAHATTPGSTDVGAKPISEAIGGGGASFIDAPTRRRESPARAKSRTRPSPSPSPRRACRSRRRRG